MVTTKNKYGIKAYGKWEYFPTMKAYQTHLMEWMRNTDGAERDRAVNALTALAAGQKLYDSDQEG